MASSGRRRGSSRNSADFPRFRNRFQRLDRNSAFGISNLIHLPWKSGAAMAALQGADGQGMQSGRSIPIYFLPARPVLSIGGRRNPADRRRSEPVSTTKVLPTGPQCEYACFCSVWQAQFEFGCRQAAEDHRCTNVQIIYIHCTYLE